jgi:hypothetical protein
MGSTFDGEGEVVNQMIEAVTLSIGLTIMLSVVCPYIFASVLAKSLK